jgi:hypothetical protein
VATKTSVVTEVAGDEYNYLRFIIIFRNTTIQCYNSIQQYDYSMSFFHTYFTIWFGSRRPSMPRTLPGGEFRSRSLQVFATLLDATRSREGGILLSD